MSDDFWKKHERAIRRRKALIRLVTRKGAERPLMIPTKKGVFPGNVWLLVHRDTYEHRVGTWRLTRFDDDGAFGHSEHTSYGDAIDSAARDWSGDLERAEIAKR